ncbi:CHAD domain-containing protein [Nitrospira sp. Kam-Ns4a]
MRASRAAGHDRAAAYRTVALQALAQLAGGDRRAKTLHRLRVHLRRLQAYLELVGEEANARTLARCVSRLSRLRTLQVFQAYLKQSKAPKADRDAIRAKTKALWKKLDRQRVWKKLTRCVERRALPPMPGAPDWMAARLPALRQAQAEALRELIEAARADPRRKTFHAIRLKVKTVRYQEEWAATQSVGRTDLIPHLKRIQTVLGEYEERVQFRKLARRLGLRSRKRLEKEWRRAHRRARAVPARLDAILASLAQDTILPFPAGTRRRDKRTATVAG